MKLTLSLLSLLLVSAGSVSAAEPNRTLDTDVSLGSATSIEVKVPVGDLTVTGTGGERIKARLEIFCDADAGASCLEAAKKLAVNTRNRGSELLVQVEGYPRISHRGLSANLKVEVPRGVRFEADGGVGDVRISGMNGDVEVGQGVGDVFIQVDKGKVHRVELDTGVGEAVLVIDGGRIEGSGLVSKGLEWTGGKGAALIEVDTGVGDITVELD
ncbi:MAG TPA: hypothetical protein VF017_02805 [Thermoanaerobaculia bacterium]|nr:hypothetical protein [Thermoanaerobaculia bacterium]